MGRGPFYTAAEYRRAEQLKALGLTWADVAERLGRGADALTEAMGKYRQRENARRGVRPPG